MLEIHKKIVLDEDQRPFAVQVPIEEFERLEEVIENYGLSKLMDEVKEEEKLSIEEAKTFYKSLKGHGVRLSMLQFTPVFQKRPEGGTGLKSFT
jgi:hypothetical protein